MIWSARDRRKMSTSGSKTASRRRARSPRHGRRRRRPDDDAEQRHVEEGQAHEHPGPAEPLPERDRDRSGKQHRGSVERDARADGGALLRLLEHVDGVAVDDDVLGRRPEGHEDREAATAATRGESAWIASTPIPARSRTCQTTIQERLRPRTPGSSG